MSRALVKPVFNRFAGKCDGDHGMPECASSDCWHRDPPEPDSDDVSTEDLATAKRAEAIDRVDCWACGDRGACPYCPIEWEGCQDCEGTGHCQECPDGEDEHLWGGDHIGRQT